MSKDYLGQASEAAHAIGHWFGGYGPNDAIGRDLARKCIESEGLDVITLEYAGGRFVATVRERFPRLMDNRA